MMLKVKLGVLTSLVLSATSVAFADQSTNNPYDDSSVVVEHNVMMPARDGVLLATDVFRPAAQGKYPVILTRDPYDNGSDDASVAEGQLWAKRGYALSALQLLAPNLPLSLSQK